MKVDKKLEEASLGCQCLICENCLEEECLRCKDISCSECDCSVENGFKCEKYKLDELMLEMLD